MNVWIHQTGTYAYADRQKEKKGSHLPALLPLKPGGQSYKTNKQA